MSENWFKRAILPKTEAENTPKHIHMPPPANTPTSASAPFHDDARELPEPPYPNPARRMGATGTHRCRLRHDWPAIDAAMEAAGWPKTTNTDTTNGATTRREGEE